MKAFQKRKTIAQKIRNIVIAAVIMLVLFIGAGAAYVYYSGKTEVVPETTTSETTATEQQKRPEALKTDPNGPVGASVLFLNSPVKPGENTTINVHTKPEATCVIVAAYNKVVSKDSGLVEKKADIHGTVTWTWTVDKTAALGKWPMKVTCKYGEKVGYVEGVLEVIK